MIVMDVNVFLYSLVEGEKSEAARHVITADTKWIAPSLLRYEFINVLATWNRRGIMNPVDCRKTWDRAREMMSGNLVESDPNLVLNLSLDHQITAYDAQYVQIAAARNLPLVTEDLELLRKFPRIAISMADFLKTR